ncbi:MAG: hypothetical protein ACP5N3_03175 [Candidatus Nanoarchaeia archaeon]
MINKKLKNALDDALLIFPAAYVGFRLGAGLPTDPLSGTAAMLTYPLIRNPNLKSKLNTTVKPLLRKVEYLPFEVQYSILKEHFPLEDYLQKNFYQNKKQWSGNNEKERQKFVRDNMSEIIDYIKSPAFEADMNERITENKQISGLKISAAFGLGYFAGNALR